ncbi:MAG: hypothetical protein H6839_03965 [Planctomycetes bacterium]|nr:hypothetical protein [Planctomycetota bacterium]
MLYQLSYRPTKAGAKGTFARLEAQQGGLCFSVQRAGDSANFRPMRRFAPYLLVIAAAVVVTVLLPTPDRPVQADVSEVARTTGVRVLGATRGYATTALWLRAGDAYRRGDLYETLATYELIRELQPRNPAVYSYLAWNQAYNISAQFPERERRAYWVVLGLTTLFEGQRRLPDDASLRLDEWNFILNRSISYPAPILEAERDHFDGAAETWERVVDVALRLRKELSDADAAALDDFLENVGLQINLFDTADAYAGLSATDRERLLDPGFEELSPAEQGELGSAFEPYEREQMRSLLVLTPDVLAFLAVAHWCRLHAMVLAITPALEAKPHGLAVESALLNAVRLANLRIPPTLAPETRQDFERGYKEAVAQAFVSGIENALRIGGRKAADDFVDAMKFNFEGQPDLLPPELIERAQQEIHE